MTPSNCFKIIPAALLLLIFLFPGGYGHPVFAKDPEKGKKNEEMTIRNPAAFIADNLQKTKETLQNLREDYEKNCGSLLLDAIAGGGNPGEIAGKLPHPKTLRFHVTYPEETLRPINLSNLQNPKYTAVLQSIYLPNEYNAYVAADADTAMLLNIKNKISPADPAFVPKISFSVLEDTFSLVSHFCGAMKRDMSSGEVNLFSVPSDLRGKLGIGTTTSGGAYLTSNGFVVFSEPGIQTVTVSGKGGLKGINPKPCEGRDVWTDFVSASLDKTRSMKFQAVKFKAFGIPGLDLKFEDARAPFLDYFVPVRQNANGVIANTKSLSTSAKEPFMLDIYADPYAIGSIGPALMIDTGEQKEKIFETSTFPVTVRTEVKSAGPILPDGKGFLQYTGGFGASTIAWQLGKLETGRRTVKHQFTVNAVEAQLAPEMRDGLLAQGGEYPVKLQVLGEADMGFNYTVNWNAEGPAKWKYAKTYFQKEGDIWTAVNILKAEVFDKWSDGINQAISFSASVSYAPVTGADHQWKELLRELQMLSPPPPQDVFRLRGSAKLTMPVAEKLKLLVRFDGREQREMDEIDLFYPNAKAPSIRLIPNLLLKNIKEPMTLGELKVPVQIEFKSTNPGAAGVSAGGQLSGRAVDPMETEISAKINGYANINDPKEDYKMLEINGDKLFSNSIWVNVNRLIIFSSPQSGKTLYKLSVSGAGNMSKYKAIWKTTGIAGASQTETTFEKDQDAYVTTLLSGSRLDHVRIVLDDLVLAQLDAQNATAQAAIVLLPTHPPVATVKNDLQSNADPFKNMADCVSTVTRWSDMWGFETDGKPESYCRQKLQQQAGELQQKQAQNRLTEQLKQKGLDLVVFNDAMKVGAAVTGLAREFWNRTSCRWSIASNSKLYLEQDMTPVQMSSEMLGGCFNVVKGIRENFDPAAVISVELTLDTDMPNFPLFLDPEKYVGSTDEFRR